MWVRSQDKKYLVNVNFTWINNIFTVIGDFNNLDDTTGTPLGKYNSEEEAVKVMDMIQDHIGNLAYTQFYSENMDFVSPCFQMPPAGFSEKKVTE